MSQTSNIAASDLQSAGKEQASSKRRLLRAGRISRRAPAIVPTPPVEFQQQRVVGRSDSSLAVVLRLRLDASGLGDHCNAYSGNVALGAALLRRPRARTGSSHS